MSPIFSLKHEDPKYPGYICDINWDYQDEKGAWSRSIGRTDGILCFEYTPSIAGLDDLAFQHLLSRFGLLKWREEITIETKEVNLIEAHSFLLFRETAVISDIGKRIILKMSPAQLIAKRREKEKLYESHGLPGLIIDVGKMLILRMSLAQFMAKWRRKEGWSGLPRLEVVTDNLHIEAGKGKILHYAEEYQ